MSSFVPFIGRLKGFLSQFSSHLRQKKTTTDVNLLCTFILTTKSRETPSSWLRFKKLAVPLYYE